MRPALSALHAIHSRSPATLFSGDEVYRMTSGFEAEVAALAAARDPAQVIADTKAFMAARRAAQAKQVAA